jgi:hypothetical protein
MVHCIAFGLIRLNRWRNPPLSGVEFAAALAEPGTPVIC